jgi:hypothetical protein
LYHVINDRNLNDDFHQDDDAVMDQFNLSQEEKDAVKVMGNVHGLGSNTKKSAVNVLMDYLGEEILADHYPKIW